MTYTHNLKSVECQALDNLCNNLQLIELSGIRTHIPEIIGFTIHQYSNLKFITEAKLVFDSENDWLSFKYKLQPHKPIMKPSDFTKRYNPQEVLNWDLYKQWNSTHPHGTGIFRAWLEENIEGILSATWDEDDSGKWGLVVSFQSEAHYTWFLLQQ